MSFEDRSNFTPSRRSRQHGFSLLELILALAMTAMLAMSLYTAMNAATRARRTATNAVESTRIASIAMELIKQDLENIPPPGSVDGTQFKLAGAFTGTHQTGAGAGDNDVVDFYTVGSDVTSLTDTDPLAEGIRGVELAIKTDVNPPVLVRRVMRNLLAPVQQQPDEEVLCTGVRGFSLRYFDGTDWLTDWDSTQQQGLPYAVEVTLDLDQPNATSSSTDAASTRRISRIIMLPCHM